MTCWRPDRRWIALFVLLILGICLESEPQQVTAGQADEQANIGGVVVDFGDGRISYALVPFDKDTVSGVDLLERSGLDLLTVEFGAMGEGICMIEQTGCDVSACRDRLCQTGNPDSPFWQYVRQSGPGQWELAPLGASSSIVEDGDVDGWFWTGEIPDSNALSVDEIADRLGIDLQQFRSYSASSNDAVMMTVGQIADDTPVTGRRDAIAASAIVAGLSAIGGYAVWRSRQPSTR